MRISGSKKVKQFIIKHPSCRAVMNAWLGTVRETIWLNPADITNTFNKTDCVKAVWIFNIGGNKYRLAAKVFFGTQRVHILKVQTHAEYDQEDREAGPPARETAKPPKPLETTKPSKPPETTKPLKPRNR